MPRTVAEAVVAAADGESVVECERQHGDAAVLGRLVPRAVDELHAHRAVLAHTESRLLHGDPKPDHIFVDDKPYLCERAAATLDKHLT